MTLSVLTIERYLNYSKYNTESNNVRALQKNSICKPYIFNWSDLLNTEIIITTFPKPLIKSAHSVGTFERQFNVDYIRSESVRSNNSPYGLKTIQEVFQMVI